MTTQSTAATPHGIQAKFARLVKNRKPTKRMRIRQMFREVFPMIEQHIKEGMSPNEAREFFNELAKANVCARTFANLRAEENKRLAAQTMSDGENTIHPNNVA